MPRSAFRQCPHYYSNPVTPAPAPAFAASQPNLLMCVTFCKLMILLDASVADRYCIDFCAAHWRREAVPLSRRLSASQMWMNALQTETSASRTAPARTDRARTRASAATATSCQRTNAAARVSLRSSGTTGTLFPIGWFTPLCPCSDPRVCGGKEGMLPEPGRHRVLRQCPGHERHQAGVLLLHRSGMGGSLRDLPLSRLPVRYVPANSPRSI